MQVAEIELFKILKTKFSESEAENIISNLESKIQSKFDEHKDELASKQDVLLVKQELKLDVANLRTEMHKMKADLIMWMFIFWIGQLGSFIAIAKFFFHQ